MNEQIGGTTGAYMQQMFPFFTINIRDPQIDSGNRGGVQAFFSRLDILDNLSQYLELNEVVVTGDCGLVILRDSTLTADDLVRLLNARWFERYGQELTGWLKEGDNEVA